MTTLRLEQLEAHPNNIRDNDGDLAELAASIASLGVLQGMAAKGHASTPWKWQCVAHRRLFVAASSTFHVVPLRGAL